MNWIGAKEVPIKRLKLPGDIKERQRARHVAELAESFKEATGGEPGNMPWVTAEMEIVAGRDRIAALMLLGKKKAWVRVGVFTRRELTLAEVHENVYRRADDRNALLARLIRETELEIAAQEGERLSGTDVPKTTARQSKDSGEMGRPATSHSAAIRQVAAETKIAPETLRKAEQRARAKDGDGAAQSGSAGNSPASPLAGEAAPPPIRTFGVPLAASTLVLATKQQAAVDALDGILRRAQAACGDVATAGLGALAERLRSELHRMAAELRQDRPAALCPVGKGSCSRACQRCHGTHLVPERQLADLPAELLDEAEPKVPNGRGGFAGIDRTTAPPMLNMGSPRHVEPTEEEKLRMAARSVRDDSERRYRVVCDACGADLSGGPCGCPAALAAEKMAAGAADAEEADEGLPF